MLVLLQRYVFENTDADTRTENSFRLYELPCRRANLLSYVWCYGRWVYCSQWPILFNYFKIVSLCCSLSLALSLSLTLLLWYLYASCKRAQLTKYPQNNDKFSPVNDINNTGILNVASLSGYNGPNYNICRNRMFVAESATLFAIAIPTINNFHANEFTEKKQQQQKIGPRVSTCVHGATMSHCKKTIKTCAKVNTHTGRERERKSIHTIAIS